ncbi:ribonuclease III [Trichloromonas sp.]|uniref:ribonuclease III n=1 Tax=Trichloromonas sp. TaxID=3069249 RepID=UPI002A3736A3|nr:ribonuclease III [Trichloromonas sp.]
MENSPAISARSASLAAQVDYAFRHEQLLREALTHKSYSNEHPDTVPGHNERLEFLGDAVLDMVISRRIFLDYPQLPEGELTRIRAEVVSEPALAAVGRRLGIGDCLWLGRGEEKSGGRHKESLIANAVEALLGAIFLDGGLEAVDPVVDRFFAAATDQAFRRKSGIDYKTRLQEVLQARQCSPPAYRLVRAEGPDHDRTYTIEVLHGGRGIGMGTGVTKKAASQQAARQALEALGE